MVLITNLFTMNFSEIQNNTLVFNYHQEDYEEWIKKFGSYVGAKKSGTRIEFAESFATGYAGAKILEPGLSYRIVNYTLNTDLEYRRMPSAEFQLMIHFLEATFKEKIECKTGEEAKIIENKDNFHSVALLTNSFTNQSLTLKKGTSIKGLSIQLSEEWLKNNVKELIAEKIEVLKQQTDMVDFITAKHRKILLALLNDTEQTYLPELFIKSRVLKLTEEFLNNLCRRGLKSMPEFANPKDFHALVNVENLITKQYATEFPSIETLAKAAYMSESKLKKLFKKAYGMAIYQYYQKNRMHKAKELLNSRKHSISQIGVMLGYQNMSNFSAAFKKEFSILPSEFRQAV